MLAIEQAVQSICLFIESTMSFCVAVCRKLRDNPCSLLRATQDALWCCFVLERTQALEMFSANLL